MKTLQNVSPPFFVFCSFHGRNMCNVIERFEVRSCFRSQDFGGNYEHFICDKMNRYVLCLYLSGIPNRNRETVWSTSDGHRTELRTRTQKWVTIMTESAQWAVQWTMHCSE